MSIYMMNNNALNILEQEYGKLHFKASNSAENLNIVTNTGSNLPSSKYLSVWINGQITEQLYNSISFNSGDDVQIRLIPHPNPSLSGHFGTGRFYPVFTFYNDQSVDECYELPLMKPSVNGVTTYLGDLFRNCSVSYVPTNIFKRFPYITGWNYSYYNGLFYGASNLNIQLSKDMFKDMLNLTDIAHAFTGCSALYSSLPNEMFKNNTKIISFGANYGETGAFYGCTSLYGTIPEDFFSYAPNLKWVDYCFAACPNLTGPIPNGLFDNNPLLTSVISLFYGCTGLTGNIPNDLFRYNPNLVNFGTRWNDGVFGNCSNLTDFELYISSEVVANATGFCWKNTNYTRIIHVKAGSQTEATFNSVADACGLTIISDM